MRDSGPWTLVSPLRSDHQTCSSVKRFSLGLFCSKGTNRTRSDLCLAHTWCVTCHVPSEQRALVPTGSMRLQRRYTCAENPSTLQQSSRRDPNHLAPSPSPPSLLVPSCGGTRCLRRLIDLCEELSSLIVHQTRSRRANTAPCAAKTPTANARHFLTPLPPSRRGNVARNDVT